VIFLIYAKVNELFHLHFTEVIGEHQTSIPSTNANESQFLGSIDVFLPDWNPIWSMGSAVSIDGSVDHLEIILFGCQMHGWDALNGLFEMFKIEKEKSKNNNKNVRREILISSTLQAVSRLNKRPL
jgi:hypothetical protein